MDYKEIKLKDGLWLSFNKEDEAFSKLSSLLNEGYTLESSQGLAIILTKGKEKIALTYLDIYKDITELADFNSYVSKPQLIRPDYTKTFLNVLGEIRAHFGSDNCYESNYFVNKYLESKHYKHIVILLLDGLGTTILNHHLPKDSFLRRNFKESLISIYPSTTAAATTAIKSGLEPRVNGWTGWENYISEADRNVILFTGNDYFTEEPTGINLYKLLPYKPFYDGLNSNGFIVEPDFSKPIKLKNELKRALKNIKKNSSTIQYVYTTEPDSSLHVYGLASKEVNRVILNLNREVERFAKHLPQDALLIVTADHGHRDVRPINILECKPLMDMLERMPANDSRALAFKVKKEYIKAFPILFNKLFGEIYELHPSKELLAKGYFGNSLETNPRVYDFIGDYFALGTNDYFLTYTKPKDNQAPFKSHHAGITANEMLVPLIIYGGHHEDFID